ncbi:MAG: hypothetical protein KatS3mg068_0848 [Candidatus Sericytochromatia bacterium]|nr:MAG: hypothetical protein KatS3mg068_0848 [Candidatus Sericytochromatia bacterium]
MKMKKIIISLLFTFFLSLNSLANQINSTDLDNKIFTIDVSVDREQKSYIVSCLGSIKNKTDNIYKNLKSKIVLLNTNKEKIEEIILENIDKLLPREEKSIKVEKFVNSNKVSPFEIRAILEINNYEKISFIDVANFFINSDKKSLDYWNINYNDNDFSSESSKRNAAINTLLLVKEDDNLYNNATEMIDKLKFEEAIDNIKLLDYKTALKNLLSISNKTNYYNMANNEINKIRNKVIFEKAKEEIKNKNYFKALNLLRSISTNDKEYKKVVQEINKLNFIIRTSKLRLENIDFKYKSKDEISVLNGMESNPELILENTPEKNFYTWIFPDYSTFVFKDGILVNYKLYKLN